MQSNAGVLRIALALLALAGWHTIGAAQRSNGPAAAPGSNGSSVSFNDVTSPANAAITTLNGASPDKHLPETMGSGGAFVDLDSDGWVDIVLVDGGSIGDPQVARRAQPRVLRNRRNGTFEDVTARSGIRQHGYGMGVCAGDIDNDGHVDLYITGVGSNTLYKNRGDFTFTDVTASAGVAGGGWSTSCAFADLDLDGDLDLFVTRYV